MDSFHQCPEATQTLQIALNHHFGGTDWHARQLFRDRRNYVCHIIREPSAWKSTLVRAGAACPRNTWGDTFNGDQMPVISLSRNKPIGAPLLSASETLQTGEVGGGAPKIKCSFGGTLNHQTLPGLASNPLHSAMHNTGSYSGATVGLVWHSRFVMPNAIADKCHYGVCLLGAAGAPSLFNSQIAFSTSFFWQANRFARHYISFYAPHSFRCTYTYGRSVWKYRDEVIAGIQGWLYSHD